MDQPSSTKKILHQVNLDVSLTLLSFLITHKIVKKTALSGQCNDKTIETWSIEPREGNEK